MYLIFQYSYERDFMIIYLGFLVIMFLKEEGYWRELTRVTNHKGYYRLVIQDDLHKRHYVQVSRLVALAWVPNPDNKPFVCHRDNNPKNNFYKNLYWGTQSENIQQCVKDGRHNSCKLDM